MTDQGYPPEDHEQHLADLSVTRPHAVEYWRFTYDGGFQAHGTAGDTDPSTEELRQVLMHYRAVFDEFLGAGGGDRDVHRRGRTTAHRTPSGERIRQRARRHA